MGNMGYLDYNGLRYYDEKIKNHITVEDNKILDKYGNALSIEDIDEICK